MCMFPLSSCFTIMYTHEKTLLKLQKNNLEKHIPNLQKSVNPKINKTAWILIAIDYQKIEELVALVFKAINMLKLSINGIAKSRRRFLI